VTIGCLLVFGTVFVFPKNLSFLQTLVPPP
jgi:hypothetical protein